MARMLIVVGDALQVGGSVLTGSPYTDIDGRAVARMGDRVICARHGPGTIISGDVTLVIDGQPAARHGDKASCGCALLAGKQQLAHASAGGAPVAVGAMTAVRSIPTLSPRPVASSLVGDQMPPNRVEHCWLNDHSRQVLEYPDGRYFEAYEPDGTRLEHDLVSSFRVDVPLKSGGDILVTVKVKVVKRGRVSDQDVETAKARLLRGIDLGINNKFTVQVTDGAYGSRSFPIRYVVEFVTGDEDCMMLLHARYPREKVSGSTIYVSVQTNSWVHLHEFMHALGLPDEYMEKDQAERTVRFFQPNRVLSSDAVVTRTSREASDPDATLMSDHHNIVLKPRHAWNIGLEVQELLGREIGREIACTVTRSS